MARRAIQHQFRRKLLETEPSLGRTIVETQCTLGETDAQLRAISGLRRTTAAFDPKWALYVGRLNRPFCGRSRRGVPGGRMRRDPCREGKR